MVGNRIFLLGGFNLIGSIAHSPATLIMAALTSEEVAINMPPIRKYLRARISGEASNVNSDGTVPTPQKAEGR